MNDEIERIGSTSAPLPLDHHISALDIQVLNALKLQSFLTSETTLPVPVIEEDLGGTQKVKLN